MRPSAGFIIAGQDSHILLIISSLENTDSGKSRDDEKCAGVVSPIFLRCLIIKEQNDEKGLKNTESFKKIVFSASENGP